MVSPSTPVGTTGIWAVGTLFDIYTREEWIGAES